MHALTVIKQERARFVLDFLLQSYDCNLVVLGCNKKVVWSTNVKPKPKGTCRGRIRDDGIVELVTDTEVVYWRSLPYVV
jgi:hypothetical protein